MTTSLTRRMFLGAALPAGAVGIGAVTLEKSANANAALAVPPAEPPLPAATDVSGTRHDELVSRTAVSIAIDGVVNAG